VPFEILATAADDDPMIARALAAYYRSAAISGMVKHPSNRSYRGTAGNGRRYIVLVASTNEILAVYRVRPQGLLKRLRRWPADVMVWAPRRDPINRWADF
jgi:hypothetical protein